MAGMIYQHLVKEDLTAYENPSANCHRELHAGVISV